MSLIKSIRNIILIHLFVFHYLPIFAEAPLLNIKKNTERIDTCGANILKSYRVSSPSFLCSDPNVNGFIFSIEGIGVSTGYYILKPDTTPILIEYTDGTFRLEMAVVMKTDMLKEYLIEMTGTSKSMNNPEFGLTPALNYCASTNSEGWIFYNQFVLKLTGKNVNLGQLFEFNSPQANGHTFQIGQGANTWQSTLGSGLWFDNAQTKDETPTIKGDLQISLAPYECCDKKTICVPFIVSKNH